MSDIVIIGAGPVGATLAALLAGGQHNVTVIEAQKNAEALFAQQRTLALAEGSRRILEHTKVWPTDAVTPITSIHTSQQGTFGRSVISAAEMDVPALGYVLTYGALSHALLQRLRDSNVDVKFGAALSAIEQNQSKMCATVQSGQGAQTLDADLLVLADGGSSLALLPEIAVEEKDYHQRAVLALIHADRPHNGIAYERFTADGPAALLPKGDGYSLVWTATPEEAERIVALDDATFLAEFQAHFGWRAGRFTRVGPRLSFPLRLKRLAAKTLGRVAIIGNAAQTLHPVAGQGLNIGLRDAQALAMAVQHATDAGAASIMQTFVDARERDTERGILFTDWLVRGFSGANPVLGALRGAAISALDVLPVARRALARRMLFGG